MGFLTDAQLEVIQNLVAMGDQAGAADQAIKLFAESLSSRSSKMVENTGYLEKAWKGVSFAVREAWDLIKSVGREDTTAQKLTTQTRKLVEAEEALKFARTDRAKAAAAAAVAEIKGNIDVLNSSKAVATGGGAGGQSPEQRRALEANAKLRDQNRQEEEAAAKKSESLAERLEVVRTKAARDGVTDRTAIAKAEALETTKFQEEQERKAKKPRGDGDGGLANARLSAIKAQGSAEQATIAAQTKDVQEQYRARSISANDYYERLRVLAAQSTAAEVNTLQQQIAATEEQSKSRKSSAAIAEQVTALEAQLNKVRAEGESKLRSITAQEDDARRKREEGLRAYREALAAQTATLRDQMSNMVDRESMGSREFEVQSKINDVYAEQARRLREIADAQGQGNLSVDGANVRRDSLRSEVQERVEVIKQGYADVDAARLDFSNGVQRGFAEFATSSLDVAGQVASAMGSAFGGMEDALVNFAKTGKLSFKELANSILEDLTRIAIKIALTKALEGMFGGGGATAAAGNSAVSSGTGAILSKLGGFSSGGYTGDGGKNDPAGVVHKGEVVFSQDDVARAGGVSAVERMRLGAQGSLSSTGSSTGATGGVVVNLIGLDKAPKEQRQSQVNGQMQIDMIFEEIDSRAAEGVANGTSRLAMALGRKG
jgi:lambda family phage tail tape measure protein